MTSWYDAFALPETGDVVAAIVVLSGPSGAGKSTLVERIVAAVPRLHTAVSLTTRPLRRGDKPNQYCHVDRSEFLRWVAEGRLLEWAEVHGNLYGTIPPDPDHDVLLEIDIQGAHTVKVRFSHSYLILVLPPEPHLTVLEMRLRGRQDQSEESIRRRLSVAAWEIERGLEEADTVVVNEDLDRSTAEVIAIVREQMTLAESAAPGRLGQRLLSRSPGDQDRLVEGSRAEQHQHDIH